jgi:hypothetical protein
MSICTSGSSTTKPGVPAAVYVDSNYAQSLLPSALAFLYPYLPFMHGLEIGNVATFCTSDPPIIPAIPSAADIAAFVSGSSLSSALNVNEFLQNLTKTYLWYGLCQCSDTTSPALPSAPADPGGLIAVNPGPYVALPINSTPCQTASGADTRSLPVGGGYGAVDLIGTGSGAGSFAGDGLLAPTGINTYRFTFTNTAGPTNPDSLKFSVSGAKGSVVGVAGVGANLPAMFTQITVASGGSTTVDIVADPLITRLYLNATFVAHPNTTNVASFTMQAFCGAAPNATSRSCCPPDPISTGMLNSILNLVTLIQRQAVPFAYIASTSHAGLSGAGTLAISGLIGAKVDLTTTPGSLGVEGTTPAQLFDAGWITFGVTDGYPSSFRLTHDPQVFLPPRCGLFTTLAYDLHPGVVVTITELLREA